MSNYSVLSLNSCYN